ncbi:hypothetical protein [Nostoc sp. WHI]|uniref:hypothetical protein n=1 Tax=Nostoc sp. WHI TaxID=2650611 RepID=UPI001E3A7CA6|nr:hypothetical protein [Nostoc sp. WHI]MBG1265657.1 hypothetical protein [Nostoc sp. WHI]
MIILTLILDACWQSDSDCYMSGIKSLFRFRNLSWKLAASFFNICPFNLLKEGRSRQNKN